MENPHIAHKNLWYCTTLFRGKTNYREIAKIEETIFVCLF